MTPEKKKKKKRKNDKRCYRIEDKIQTINNT